ncbi:DUF4278 domain-containing protein [Myxosarcina sp. GI1]|uniref:DUF4278 domain-containing protein n=1 Tax=Myxosarcina sp. GI1 TaxID=1541065 RepID=UPI00055EE1AA|nr:DUF4278 domain-containing protein [Myxosarcina sp. GI1]
MKLSYRGVNYKSEAVIFHQLQSNSFITGKYQGQQSAIAPSINLAHHNHLQLKYRSVQYARGWGKSERETFPQLQLQSVAA